VLILSLAWANDRRQTLPVSRRELAGLRGIALRTLDAHLAALRAKGYVRNAPGRAGLKMILIPTALAPDPGRGQAPDLPAKAGTGGHAGIKSKQPSPCAVPTTPAGDGDPQQAHQPAQSAPDAQPARPHPPPASCDVGIEKKLNTSVGKEELLLLIKRLTAAGVYPVVAERLAREPWVTLELVEAWVRALRQQPRVRHLGGLLTAILRQPATCLPPPLTPVYTGASPSSEAPGGGKDTSEPVQDAIGASDEPPAEEAPPCDVPWEEVLGRLRQRLGAKRVEVWLDGSLPLCLEDKQLVIALRSPFAVDWVRNCHKRDIEAALKEVTAREYRVSFVVAGNG